VRSWVRPSCAAYLAAGLDAVRGLDPDQFAALGRRARHYGLVQFAVRHYAITLAILGAAWRLRQLYANLVASEHLNLLKFIQKRFGAAQ
jgi:hypothetical protein